ncbi:WD40 repeat domain-containing protein [Endozoicomonas ascidiicola]|uniref:WD40 repeat domain-containing protein n=1 Tax=Endozoicomonas ascidiicola TaxID=1698521 RepID=UPI0008324B76|nr:WD40 repeat domain-containing protein [Endozoicomonas ascidiicola]
MPHKNWFRGASTHADSPARFSPNGRYFTTDPDTDKPNAVDIWEPSGDSWKKKGTVQHEGKIFHIVYNPDSQYIVTTSYGENPDEHGRYVLAPYDASLRINRLTGDHLQETTFFALEHRGLVTHIGFSPDSSYLYLSYQYNGRTGEIAQIWEIANGNITRKAGSIPAQTNFDRLETASFHPAGCLFLALSRNTVMLHKLINNERWQEVERIEYETQPEEARFSPDGTQLMITAGRRHRMHYSLISNPTHDIQAFR